MKIEKWRNNVPFPIESGLHHVFKTDVYDVCGEIQERAWKRLCDDVDRSKHGSQHRVANTEQGEFQLQEDMWTTSIRNM